MPSFSFREVKRDNGYANRVNHDIAKRPLATLHEELVEFIRDRIEICSEEGDLENCLKGERRKRGAESSRKEKGEYCVFDDMSELTY